MKPLQKAPNLIDYKENMKLIEECLVFFIFFLKKGVGVKDINHTFSMYLFPLEKDFMYLLWVHLHVAPPCFYSGPEGPKTLLNTILSYS